MKEIFLYNGFYDYTMQALIQEMQLQKDMDDISVRMNSGGGSVFSAQGFFKEMQSRRESGKTTTILVDGNASSCGFFSLYYADKVKILSTTKALAHRADMYIENESDQNLVDKTNDELKTLMLSRTTSDRFKEVTGVSIDEIFDRVKRVEVWLTAQNLVDIGLVKTENVMVLTPALAASISKNMSAYFGDFKEQTNLNSTIIMAEQNTKTPEAAIADERDRVSGWMSWLDVDANAVKAGIESGKTITAKEISEFSRKLADKSVLEALAANSITGIETPKTTELTPEAAHSKELEDFEKKLNDVANIKK
jgi:ATP-dependent protease ClpP protease subunit